MLLDDTSLEMKHSSRCSSKTFRSQNSGSHVIDNKYTDDGYNLLIYNNTQRSILQIITSATAIPGSTTQFRPRNIPGVIEATVLDAFEVRFNCSWNSFRSHFLASTLFSILWCNIFGTLFIFIAICVFAAVFQIKKQFHVPSANISPTKVCNLYKTQSRYNSRVILTRNLKAKKIQKKKCLLPESN